MSPPGSSASTPVVSASAVALAVVDFLIRTERERMRLFRDYLRSTVVQVSPLLLEFAAMEQVDLAAAIAPMRPPQDWPWRALYDPSAPVTRQWQARRFLLGHDARRRSSRFRRTFANPGVVIRSVDHPRGWLGVRPVGGVLGFAASLGPCLLCVFDTVAMIRLPEPLPESLVIAMPGRRLGELVEHPLFRGRDYIVNRVLVDPADDLPVLAFKVSLVPFVLPLADDVGGVVGRPEDRW